MLAPFIGFGPQAIEWFRGLEADNSKAYFERTRPVWEAQVRGPLERLLDQRFATLVEAIAASRSLTPEQVRALIDRAPYIGQTACDVGLVDGLCYEDELKRYLEASEVPISGTQAPAQASKSKLIIGDWRAARQERLGA